MMTKALVYECFWRCNLMDKTITKLIVSLVLGCLLSYLITFVAALNVVILWVVVIALFAAIYAIAGKWIRQAMPGMVGIIGSVVCAAVAALVLACINVWTGGLIIVRIIHIIACALLVYVIDHKVGTKQ